MDACLYPKTKQRVENSSFLATWALYCRCQHPDLFPSLCVKQTITTGDKWNMGDIYVCSTLWSEQFVSPFDRRQHCFKIYTPGGPAPVTGDICIIGQNMKDTDLFRLLLFHLGRPLMGAVELKQHVERGIDGCAGAASSPRESRIIRFHTIW